MRKTFTVTETEADARLDVLCAKKFPQISRTRWQQAGQFVCMGVEKSAKTKAREGESWEVECTEDSVAPDHLEPWDFPLKILAEGKTWVAIEKPKGVSVHPSPSDPSQHTVVNALVHQFKNLSENADEIDGVQCPRPGLVHRLDRGTSGVLLVAKTNATHRALQEHWGQVQKVYFAVVTGHPPVQGNIESGIARDPQDRKKMKATNVGKARDAITNFERKEQKGDRALLWIEIPTGRTHQIRVHLATVGFPIVGDGLYGGEEARRVYLHAAELTFPDPDKNGEMTTVQSPIPEDFLTLGA